MTDPSNLFLLIQTGGQRSQGVEFDIAAQLLPGWKFITTYAYTDARVTADTTIAVGNRLPLIARHIGSIWTTYDFQNGLLQGFGRSYVELCTWSTSRDPNTPIRDIPGSVRIINRDLIDDQKALHIGDALHNVSGVCVAADSLLSIWNLIIPFPFQTARFLAV